MPENIKKIEKIVFDLEELNKFLEEDCKTTEYPQCSKWDLIEDYYQIDGLGQICNVMKWSKDNGEYEINYEFDILIKGIRKIPEINEKLLKYLKKVSNDELTHRYIKWFVDDLIPGIKNGDFDE